MARCASVNNNGGHTGTVEFCGAKLYIQKKGVFICGKPKEIRRLLKACASKYRTIKELISYNLN